MIYAEELSEARVRKAETRTKAKQKLLHDSHSEQHILGSCPLTRIQYYSKLELSDHNPQVKSMQQANGNMSLPLTHFLYLLSWHTGKGGRVNLSFEQQFCYPAGDCETTLALRIPARFCLSIRYSSSPLFTFYFPQFQLPTVNCYLKILNGKLQK